MPFFLCTFELLLLLLLLILILAFNAFFLHTRTHVVAAAATFCDIPRTRRSPRSRRLSSLLASPLLFYPMLSTTHRSHTTPHLKHTQAAAHDGVACNTVRLTFNRKSMPNAHTSLLSRTLCIYTSFLLCTLRYIYVYIYEKINKKNNHNTALRIISSPVVCRKKLCLLLQCKV